MIETQARILIVGADRDAARDLAALLVRRGMVSGAVSQAGQATSAAVRFGPGLVLFEIDADGASGYEALAALRRDLRTCHLPAAVITRSPPEGDLLNAFRAGAADFFLKPLLEADLPAIDRLLALRSPPGTPLDLPLVDRILAFAKRTRLDAEIRLASDASASARFAGGALAEARAGGRSGAEALAALLAHRDAVVARAAVARAEVAKAPPSRAKEGLEEGLEERALGLTFALSVEEPTNPAPKAAPAPGSAGRCLLVDDEPELLKLFGTYLTRAGFEVATARDGLEGYDACVVLRPAVVVADLNMPRLDGWGMLRRIREDHRLAEVPVVFLSAQDDYRESLRAVGSGAQDYLAKATKMDALAKRVREALAPRALAAASIAAGKGAHGRVEQLGARWLLQQVSNARGAGTVACSDGLGVYNVGFRAGATVFAGAQVGSTRAGGEEALQLLTHVRSGDLQYLPDAAPPTENLQGALPILLERVAARCNAEEKAAVDELLVKATRVEVDGALFALYERFCSPAARQIASGFRDGKTPKQIMAESEVSPLEVEDTIRDLVRRRVIGLKGNG